MIDLDAHYQRDPSMVYREIAGETILVPIRRNLADVESIYTLNETAARAWGLFDGERSLGDIVQALSQEYNVDVDQIQDDLIELIDQLTSIGAIGLT